METSTATLPASKSSQVRVTTLVRVTPKGKPVTGVLELSEARRAGNKPKVRRYAVCELEPSGGGRRFKLSKPLAARRQDEEHEYVVWLAYPVTRAFDKCSCLAAANAGRCSHAECLRAHMRQGNVPPVTELKLPPPPPKEHRLLTDRGYMRVSAPNREEAIKIAEGDGYTVRPEFPDSPTCNPAAVAEYWKKVHIVKSENRPADFFHPWGKSKYKRRAGGRKGGKC